MNNTVRKFASSQVNKLKALSCKLVVIAGLMLVALFMLFLQAFDFRLPQGGPTTAQILKEMAAAVERAIGSEPKAKAYVGAIEYEVQRGDTLKSIAQKFQTPLAQIIASNDIFSLHSLTPGQTLRIPKNGIIHPVKRGQTLTDISITYGIPIEQIVAANALEQRKYIYAGEELFIPGALTPPKLNAIKLAKGQRALFNWPLFGNITSGFGPRRHPITRERHFHEGIDIAADEGTSVYAARAGKVIFAGPSGGYGYLIILDHGLYETYYAHLSEILVYKGQFVEAGQLIARSGNTGFSTGPHLHFEIRLRGTPVSPSDYLP